MVSASLRRIVSAAVLLAALGGLPAAAQGPVLQLIVDETRVRLGAPEALVVVRTVQDLALASGSFAIDLRDHDGGDNTAFDALLGVDVYSGASDATASANFDPATQRTEVSFASASGTVNAQFGPMVVLHYQLTSGLVENRRFDLRIVPDSVSLTAAGGGSVGAFTDHGRIRISRADRDPSLEAEGGHFPPGSAVILGAATELSGPLGSGTIEFVFDPFWQAGAPTASIQPHHGNGVIDSVTVTQPGHVLVAFHSPDGTLNETLPGPFLVLAVPSDPAVPLGTRTTVTLGPATVVLDAFGQLVEVEPKIEDVEFEAAELEFEGDFDDGGFDDFWEHQF